MAAILALIFVPAFAAILFMVGLASGTPTLATAAAATIFIALAAGVFVGLMRLMRHWEVDEA